MLYNKTELFCFIGSHLAKPHKRSLMQFLPAFYSNHLMSTDCDAPHRICLALEKWKGFTSQTAQNENTHLVAAFLTLCTV